MSSLLDVGMWGGNAALGWAAQEDAQDFAKTVLKKQIRWRVNDMKKAGINPILAVGSGMGGAGGGGGAMMRPPDLLQGTSARSQASTAKRRQKKEADVMDAQIDLANSSKALNDAKEITEQIIQDKTGFEAMVASENARLQRANATMAENLLPASESEKELDKSKVGDILRKVRRAAEAITPFK